MRTRTSNFRSRSAASRNRTKYEYDDPTDSIADSLNGGVGDGNLTKIKRNVDNDAATDNDRVSRFSYDWRNRMVMRKGGVQSTETDDNTHPITYMEYDNFDHVTLIERFDGDNVSITTDTTPTPDGVPDRPADPVGGGGHDLLTQKKTFSYDNRGRVWKQTTISVEPTTGVEGQELSKQYWYSHRGQIIRVAVPGGLVTENVFDGAGRLSKVSYSDGAGGSSWDDAVTVTGDRVVEQFEYTHDANGNLTQTTRRQRFHNETASGKTGDLGTATSGVKARVSYVGYFYDNANRLTGKADVGTNFDPSDSNFDLESLASQPSPSATALVTTYAYNAAGWMETLTNPRGIGSKSYYDAVGRVIKTIQAYVDGTPSAADDQTLEFTYNGSGQLTAYKAVLPSSAIQETKYIYGEGNKTVSSVTSTTGVATAHVTAHGYHVGESIKISSTGTTDYDKVQTIVTVPDANSFTFTVTGSPGTSGAGTARRDTSIFSNDILVATQYPDKSSGSASTSEQEFYTLNAQGERTGYNDRNGNVHLYLRDQLGRLTDDRVTTLGSGVDSYVRKLGFTFNREGLPEKFTSYADPSGGTVRNEVLRTYNGFGQVLKEYQNKSGTVSTGSSPKVQYGYEDRLTGSNTSRLATITYPNGRVVRYVYWGGGIDDRISRVSYLADGSSSLAYLNGPANGPTDDGDEVSPQGYVGTHLEEYNYLGLSRVVQRTRPQPLTRLTYIKQGAESNGEAGDQYAGLDRFGRIVDQRWHSYTLDGSGNVVFGADIDRLKYGYDRNGNRLYKWNQLNSNAGSDLYYASGASSNDEYDKLDRLKAYRRGTLTDGNSDGVPDTFASQTDSETYSLDAVGNLHASNKQNQWNLESYDANGNAISWGTFDAWNRLRMHDDSGTAWLNDRVYRYDALNRKNWTHEEIPIPEEGAEPDPDKDGILVFDYTLYWSVDWQVLQTGAYLKTEQYIYSPSFVDAPIMRDRNADGNSANGLEERVYAQNDANYNTTSLTSAAGTVVTRGVYRPHGAVTFLTNLWASSSNTYVWAYLFQGARYDSVTALYDLRNRDYNVGGRFIQQDPNPAGQYNDGANLYQMERSNPVIFLDPMGNSSMQYPYPAEGGGHSPEDEGNFDLHQMQFNPSVPIPTHVPTLAEDRAMLAGSNEIRQRELAEQDEREREANRAARRDAVRLGERDTVDVNGVRISKQTIGAGVIIGIFIAPFTGFWARWVFPHS